MRSRQAIVPSQTPSLPSRTISEEVRCECWAPPGDGRGDGDSVSQLILGTQAVSAHPSALDVKLQPRFSRHVREQKPRGGGHTPRLTSVMMSLAKSLARSGVTKQDRPVSATPVSYWLGLLRSWKGRERLRGRRPLRLAGSQLRLPALLWVWRRAWTRTHKKQPAPRSVTEQEPGRL